MPDYTNFGRMARLPKWIRCSTKTDEQYARVRKLLSDMQLRTVCEDAHCPNRVECWNSGTATVMILGDTCTRDCRFCAVRSGRPLAAETDEPERVVQAAMRMKLRHLVLTSVTRDDLDDGGAEIFAECIRAVHDKLPETTVEVLIPDFQGDEESLLTVLRATPDVLNHNVETVSRLQAQIRPQASYDCSLGVLRRAAEYHGTIAVKSGIMVGLGESDDELYETMADLYNVGCRLLTLGQYLRPGREYWAVDRYVEPGKFRHYAEKAKMIGFDAVESSPMARSSYNAAEMVERVKAVNNAG